MDAGISFGMGGRGRTLRHTTVTLTYKGNRSWEKIIDEFVRLRMHVYTSMQWSNGLHDM